VETGAAPPAVAAGEGVEGVLARYAAGRELGADMSLEALGLSSLERVELMVALEDRFQTRLDETKFAGARTVDDLKALVEEAPAEAVVEEPVEFPRWNRRPLVRWVRRISLATWILPLARVFAWVQVSGLEQLKGLHGPAVFAANHQSHLDVPVILAALPGSWRARVAPAMAKEFFKAHFFPDQFRTRQVWLSRLLYYLASFFFGAFRCCARGRGAADASLHRRGHRRGALGAHLPGGHTLGIGGDPAVSRRHRDDRGPAAASRGAGEAGGRQPGAPPDVADGEARTVFGDLRPAPPPVGRRLR
jgi:acyl carrier protein